MISRLIVAIAYGVFVGIIVLIVGVVLVAVHVEPLTALGKALEQFCWAFGLIAGVLAFFGNASFPRWGGPPA